MQLNSIKSDQFNRQLSLPIWWKSRESIFHVLPQRIIRLTTRLRAGKWSGKLATYSKTILMHTWKPLWWMRRQSHKKKNFNCLALSKAVLCTSAESYKAFSWLICFTVLASESRPTNEWVFRMHVRKILVFSNPLWVLYTSYWTYSE